VLGEEGEPVVPVVADGLVRGEEVTGAVHLVEQVAEPSEADKGCGLLDQPVEAVERGLEVLVHRDRPRQDLGALGDDVVEDRKRKPQVAHAGPQESRELGEVAQEGGLNRE
jgi:hypothetical protein